MKLVAKKSELINLLKEVTQNGSSVGFVPTMGALHKGHFELLRQAKKENDILVSSIFVNPIQFNNSSDLQKYPRTLDKDIKILEESGCDFLFTPEQPDLYNAENIEEKRAAIHLNGLEHVLEGEHRPDHFKGVAFIVKTFLEIIKPTRAYFGKKDFQQLLIIKEIVKQELLNVKIIGCETIREANGLALSSRNSRLSDQEKSDASFIYQTLQTCKTKIGSLSVTEATNWVIDQFDNHEKMSCEYFQIVDAQSLTPIKTWTERASYIGCIAVKFNDIRLIDNLMFSE